jgi:L-threonine kinase
VLSVANVFLGTGLGTEALYRLAAQVEPTDPCLSDDVHVFYQHAGCRGATIELPPVTLLYFDAAPGTTVDTLSMPCRWQTGAGRFYSWLLHRLIAAAAEADYAQLFDAITYSAEYNQLLLPLPGFDELYRLAEESGAGLMVAHSGTIAGLLTKPEKAAELLPRVEALVESRRTGERAADPSCPAAETAPTVYFEHYHSSYHQTLCTVIPAR